MFEGEIVDRRINTKIRGAMQMVFQDPYSSVDPRMNVRRIIEEPLRIHSRMTKKERRDRSLPLMESLGFKEEDLEKFPHEFSGGQLQRIGIARAFITNPRFVICDEPVSALDMSIQSQILNLFKELQKERGVTYLFISHDMNVIKHVSNRIAIMYLGHVVELADKKEFFGNTLHPYSRALISAIPVPNPGHKRNRIHLSGELPNPLNPPRGCPFGTRCPKAIDLCRESLPSLKAEAPGHWAACHLLPEASGTNQGEHT
jgi:oligopeptide/dipeptide ABC transporter ATP-binding protein